MPRLALNNNEKYTYADYLTWPDDERWELVAGEAFALNAPSTDGHGESDSCVF